VQPEAVDLLVQLASGDARRALTALEVAAEAVEPGGELTVEAIEQSLDKAAVRYDRDGDQHYDVISAFIKSVRGPTSTPRCIIWPGCWSPGRIRVRRTPLGDSG